MATARIIAQGGFNTGRMYRPEGQEVYWWLMEGGKIVFCDRSRMIVGEIDVDGFEAGDVTSRVVMREYDANNYSMACQPERIPADFDFGPKLRI